jgi:hypothetical protein
MQVKYDDWYTVRLATYHHPTSDLLERHKSKTEAPDLRNPYAFKLPVHQELLRGMEYESTNGSFQLLLDALFIW